MKQESCWLLLLMLFRVYCIQKCLPYGYDIMFRPIDPFLFVDKPFQLCCGLKENGKNHTWPPKKDMFFECGRKIFTETELLPAPSGDTIYSNIFSSMVCANITTSWSGFCSCRIPDQIACRASQYVTTDTAPPSKLDFECIIYVPSDYESRPNLTCTLQVPHFKHIENVKTTFNWTILSNKKQSESPEMQNCSEYNMCVGQMQFLLLGLPYTLNITVQLEYNIPNAQTILVSAWKKITTKSKMKSDPLSVRVVNVTKTSITVSWDYQTTVPSDKIIRIDYIQEGDEKWQTSSLNVKEGKIPENIAKQTMEKTISDLLPYTFYKICLKSSPFQSMFWSEPVCLSSRTDEDVPSKSPKTFPDAFTIVDDKTVMVYWQELEEWDWRSPYNRMFILQEYDNSKSRWVDKQFLKWTEHQTTVERGNSLYYAVVASNKIGKAKNISSITISDDKNLIPGPKNLHAVYDTKKGSMKITWQSDENENAVVYWCVQGDEPNACLEHHSIQWGKVKSGDTSITLSVTNFTLARSSMYGISLSKRSGGQLLRSGIHWQTCKTVKNGDSISEQGRCKSTETVDRFKFPYWAIAVIVVTILVCFVFFVLFFVRARLKHLQKKDGYFTSTARLVIQPSPPNTTPPDTFCNIVAMSSHSDNLNQSDTGSPNSVAGISRETTDSQCNESSESVEEFENMEANPTSNLENMEANPTSNLETNPTSNLENMEANPTSNLVSGGVEIDEENKESSGKREEEDVQEEEDREMESEQDDEQDEEEEEGENENEKNKNYSHTFRLKPKSKDNINNLPTYMSIAETDSGGTSEDTDTASSSSSGLGREDDENVKDTYHNSRLRLKPKSKDNANILPTYMSIAETDSEERDTANSSSSSSLGTEDGLIQEYDDVQSVQTHKRLKASSSKQQESVGFSEQEMKISIDGSDSNSFEIEDRECSV